MSEKQKPFPFDQFESKWQQYWLENKTFRTPGPGDEDFDPSKPKYYILDMFPYPSGAGLHVGHPEGYTATDIVGRYKRMNGFNVLHPMGWDAFGLPAEQYAIKTGQHPRITTEANIKNFRRQLQALGFGYDWDREVNTTDPGYVKWTQWIFIQLYNSYFCEETQKARPISELEEKGLSREEIDDQRLAFIHEAPVNWSPSMGTVLANEEVEEWKAKGETVERRPLRQWMLRITKYAQRLIDELEPLDWPESIKALQRNWIGRSEGASVKFQVSSFKQQRETQSLEAENLKLETIEVFTTRPDTLFGATYMVLAPEHPLVEKITTAGQKEAVEAYQKTCASKSDLERGDLNKDKSGVPTGAHAINPVNGEKIPVWIADYVMMGYGTGAIMAVPAHDERDFEFAQKFNLPIIQVVGEANSERSRGVPPLKKDTPCFFDTDWARTETTTHRGNLPHWQQDGRYYFVTWRTADSLPQEKLAQLQREKKEWLNKNPEPHSDEQTTEYHRLFSSRIHNWLDNNLGSCPMRDPAIAKIVANALEHFDGERYDLEGYAVMPNHVHVVFRLCENEDLTKVLHSWKSFTAKEINNHLGQSGELWQEEYFDTLIRSPKHLGAVRQYIWDNPKRAKLNAGSYLTWLRGGYQHNNPGETPGLLSPTQATTGHGTAINSASDTLSLDGLPTAEAKAKMIDWLEAEGKGTRKIQYKLRDWLFSRQRYWGEPFPLLWDKKTGEHTTIPESELPLLQPEMEDFKPTGDPRGPLINATEWIDYSDQYERETNTMPQWAGSCWYYLRYCDPKNENAFISQEAEQYWSGSEKGSGVSPDHQAHVDLYIGGTEHAVLHLLYARFWHKILNDLGHLSTNEPFQKLVNQGLIMGEDGQKMSKSLGNIVNPDDVVSQYGADSLRLYEMFMGPLEQVKPWSMKGVEGVSRFLAKVWRVQDKVSNGDFQSPESEALIKITHATIKKVGEDINALRFNTAISAMMECVNAYTAAEEVPQDLFTDFLKILNPFAPHLTEEINHRLNHQNGEAANSTDNWQLVTDNLLSEAQWPPYDESLLVESEITIIVQVNGKLRAKLQVPADIAKDELEKIAQADENVQNFTDGKTVRKVIVVPGKLVNIVAN